MANSERRTAALLGDAQIGVELPADGRRGQAYQAVYFAHERVARNRLGAERAQMIGRQLAVDQRKVPAIQLRREVGQRYLRAVALTGEHRLAEKNSAE